MLGKFKLCLLVLRYSTDLAKVANASVELSLSILPQPKCILQNQMTYQSNIIVQRSFYPFSAHEKASYI